ncbi:imm11 family protein [Hyalangium gracile]|uniref:imm11 family protein n=1 Tax=Hyalangium gracile TaxID=394092 RepID=UPI001CC8FD2F|nr:DUF1629 domain-containing protein [Hyalangium gracile]
MPERFFKLYDDVYVPRRWHLNTPIDSHGHEVHDWDFKRGTRVDITGRLRIPIESAGRPLDFSEAGIMIPVVHVRVASMLAERAANDVQLLPAEIDGYPDQYLVLVVTRLIRCIDEKASRIRLWTQEDGLPEKVGQYRDIRGLRIDKASVGNAQVFRPQGWEVTLIVSETIKDALDRMGATGTKFEEV